VLFQAAKGPKVVLNWPGPLGELTTLPYRLSIFGWGVCSSPYPSPINNPLQALHVVIGRIVLTESLASEGREFTTHSMTRLNTSACIPGYTLGYYVDIPRRTPSDAIAVYVWLIVWHISHCPWHSVPYINFSFPRHPSLPPCTAALPRVRDPYELGLCYPGNLLLGYSASIL